MSKDKVILPKELTAENGAKALLIGEFREEIEVCGCLDGSGEDQEMQALSVPVSWTTIKEIYKMIVENMSQPIEGKQ